ncbi:MAG: glutamate--tRNA ligase [Parcubacteria group bacterium CG11_big_fil_rev_8_21_14_0_20_39_14]|nr:MAG: glutamate--tRNA ligase [Parcubacteria group bacterium CG11_big_fil_rev_8_21_14_0_20_39_14]PIS35367.1 MAG: glutamate--tRNA ligase [Parcubacteria group bacterium CG08_land_8_20_14_0_20_38_56]
MVKVRFAPAPTGFLHIGAARTAFFNYLFAKKNKGDFILRIEDTDRERSKPEYEKDILESLSWLGLKWDKKIYRQSERSKIYAKYIKQLLDKNLAYHCFCAEEELKAQRQEQLSRGEAPKYSGKCAVLSKKEAEKLKNEGKNSIIRFRAPSKKIIFQDLIRGKVEFDTGLMGDIAIAKSEKTPLYNLAAAIDDSEMKITHVIRGEDHISNTPKQILIQQALGFSQPKYAHIALILGMDKSKLSKRHGAVSISEYKKQGYLSEALINFMALLGWNPGTEKEIFSMEELIKEFSLKKMTKSGAIFNIEKLDWMNGYYIRKTPIEKLTKMCIPYLMENGLIEAVDKILNSKSKILNKSKVLNSKFQIKESGETITFEKMCDIVRLFQERLKKLSEIGELTDFFFKEELKYDKELLRWKNMTDEELKNSLEKLEKIISEIKEKDFKKEILEKLLMSEGDRAGDRGKLFWPLRVALSGKKASPGPCEIAEVLGKRKTLEKIKWARELMK